MLHEDAGFFFFLFRWSTSVLITTPAPRGFLDSSGPALDFGAELTFPNPWTLSDMMIYSRLGGTRGSTEVVLLVFVNADEPEGLYEGSGTFVDVFQLDPHHECHLLQFLIHLVLLESSASS